MNRKLVVLMALSGLADAAYAQSSVTLYGVADDGITYTNNQGGHAAYQTFSGGLGGSKFGFLRKEGLGGGTSALFPPQSGEEMNNGEIGHNHRPVGWQS